MDDRRLFSDSQKIETLEAAGYLCQGEGCLDRDLRDGKAYEFHHVKAHSEGGPTSRYNARVLCRTCHVKTFSTRNTADTIPAISGLREWQKAALKAFQDVADGGSKLFVLEAAPGAGKTLFAACAARHVLDAHPEITHVVCIAPWKSILSSMRDTFGRLQMDLRDGFHYDRSRGILQRVPETDVTVDTYAGFCDQLTVDVLEEWRRRTGFRFVLILDEVHHTRIAGGSWGPATTRIAELADMVIVMSGTFFRSDNQPISFLRYAADGKPITDYEIVYRDCVSQRYVRQVAFRFHDATFDMYVHHKREEKKYTLSKVTTGKPLQECKRRVLDPKGEHVAAMIREAHEELQKLRTKWPDAACLVVCAPGKSDEESRLIHAVEAQIKAITSVQPFVVTSDDAGSHGKIEAFRHGTEPWLCAVRMVSEGCDIPRIRVVLFLSYTDSEMLFRQIVGRALRYIPGKEDDTAALVIMPKFSVMAEFAERFEGEAKLGAAEMVDTPRTNSGGDGNGDGLCQRCCRSPCCCYVVIDSEVVAGGGQIASSGVVERYIQEAKQIIDTSPAHQHGNPVQLGDFLQRRDKLKQTAVQITIEDNRELIIANIRRIVEKLAAHLYTGNFALAYQHEFEERFGCTMDEVRGTWRASKMQDALSALKGRLREILQDA